MGAQHVLLLVAGALVLYTINAALLRYFLGRRLKRGIAQMLAAVSRGQENILRGPESAAYRGARHTYGRVKGTGILLLTDRYLRFSKALGRSFQIALNGVADVRAERSFLSSWVAGHKHLVLRLEDGNEVGFIVKDVDAWLKALSERERAAAG